MSRRSGFCALLVALIALCDRGGARAANVTISQQKSDEPLAMTVVARSLDGQRAPIERPARGAATLEIPLPAGLWEIRAVGDGVWSSPVYARDSDMTTLNVWPADPIRVVADVPTLDVRFSSAQIDSSDVVECRRSGREWTCLLPRGTHDLRFHSRGFAPEYHYGVTVPQDPGVVIPLKLVAGASLFGRVELVRGQKGSPEGIEVTLASPLNDKQRKQSTITNNRGFFLFTGLSAGDYSVQARRRALISQRCPVKVMDGVAAELNSPLTLDTPKRLTVKISPPSDQAGEPWRVQLSSVDSRLRLANVVAESPASRLGEWSHVSLVSGEYLLSIETAAGETWHTENVSVGSEDATLALTMDGMRVSGVVTLGDRPLEATLSFDGEGGQKLRSDSTGRFKGEIPRRDAHERKVLIEAETPPVRRTVRANLNPAGEGAYFAALHLPSTTLLGRVINAAREPVRATVTISGDDPDTLEQTFSAADGGFQIAGFEPALYRITAETADAGSQPVGADLKSDEVTEVELVVEPIVHVRGRVTVGDTPVVAATLVALPRGGAWTALVRNAMTNEEGFFELRLPTGTTVFDGVVAHPAFDVVFGRAAIQTGKQMRIRTRQIGGTITIECRSIRDVFLLHAGAELQAWWLADLAGGTSGASSLTIPRLEPGQYSACTQARQKCVSGFLAPHGTLRLALD